MLGRILFVISFIAIASATTSICPEDGQHFFPHPTLCSKFLECNNGKIVEQDCFGDFVFNPETLYCDFASNVDCEDAPDVEENPDSECPDDGQHFFPHPTRCGKFLECNNGQLVEQECFGDFVFNPETLICDFPSNVDCEDAPEVEEGPVGTCPPINGEFVDFLTDAASCVLFYICNWGKAIQMECPDGLHFNPSLNVCDFPYRAGCTVGQ